MGILDFRCDISCTYVHNKRLTCQYLLKWVSECIGSAQRYSTIISEGVFTISLLHDMHLAHPSAKTRGAGVRPSPVTILKHLWNHWINSTQISFGDSLGWGNESLHKCFWSHDQDSWYAHILKVQPFKTSSLEPKCQWPWDFLCSIGDDDPTKFAQMMILGWPFWGKEIFHQF